MLSKHHSLPDQFHDLKTTLQAEFNLLKKKTLKNVQNIQEAVQSQQAYTTALCSHINSLCTKLAQLDKQAQIHCLYPHPQSDVVQLSIPEYIPDIDRQLDQVTDVQSPNAETVKKETSPDIPKSEHHTAFSSNTNRPEPQPSEVSADTDHPAYHDGKQPRAEHPSDYHPQLEDIPVLETKKIGKKASLRMWTSSITTTPLREVTEYIASTLHILRKSQTKNTAFTIAQPKALNTRSLNQTITTQTIDQNSTRGIKIQTCISLPLHLLKIYVHGMVKDVEEPSIWSCIATGCMGRKPDH